MPLLTPETVRQVLHDMWGYDVAGDDAERIANMAGALATGARHLSSLGLAGIEPPFGYPMLIADAARLAAEKR
ncbi:MAG TPA: hypothetical protein VEC38_09665 [Candidatus Binataceae bacterium]|nr:hypothetical protein [Candidatus Binataceae bacterium]